MATIIYKKVENVRWDSSATFSNTRNTCDLSNYYTKTELTTAGLALVHYRNVGLLDILIGATNGVATTWGWLRIYGSGMLKGWADSSSSICTGTLHPIYSSNAPTYTFDMSLIEDSNSIVTLLNDQDNPGLNRLYGTDGFGAKGWYPIPLDSIGAIYTFAYSIESDSDEIVSLVNDMADPGSNMLYGTDALGVKGWYPQPELDSSGGGGVEYYTNLTPTQTSHGGIAAGTTFNNLSMTQMFDTILYPYMTPSFNSLTMSDYSQVLECGISITGGLHTFSWTMSWVANIQPNTVVIRDVTNAVNLGTGLSTTSPQSLDIGASITKTLTSSTHYWSISATDTHSNPITARTFHTTWYSPFYYGVGVRSLSVALIQEFYPEGCAVVAAGDKTYTFNPTSQVFYFAYPASYGLLNAIYDPNLFNITADWTLRVANFTNNPPYYNGTTVSYNIYEYNNLTTQVDFDITFEF